MQATMASPRYARLIEGATGERWLGRADLEASCRVPHMHGQLHVSDTNDKLGRLRALRYLDEGVCGTGLAVIRRTWDNWGTVRSIIRS